MMMRRLLLTVMSVLLMCTTALAGARTLTVEAVVSPAWVEHAGGGREPLVPGTELRNGDRVLTGSGARALLRMAEGSAIKLGENASLGVDRLADKGIAASRIVSGVLDVAQGAFRFTTRVSGAPCASRDLNIRIATVTAGIRGTDLWGKSSTECDVVCLIEGRIFVQHQDQAFTMQDPLSLFIAGRDGKRQPSRRYPSRGAGCRGGRKRGCDTGRQIARRRLSGVRARLSGRWRPALCRGYHRPRQRGGCCAYGGCLAQGRLFHTKLSPKLSRRPRVLPYNADHSICIIR